MMPWHPVPSALEEDQLYAKHEDQPGMWYTEPNASVIR